MRLEKSWHKPSTFKYNDGRTHKVAWSFNARYLDECTLEPLPQKHIEEAIVDELSYFNDVVWLGVPMKEALDDPEGKVLAGRFVTSDKGGLSSPDCRA